MRHLCKIGICFASKQLHLIIGLQADLTCLIVLQGASIKNLEAGSGGRIAAVKLEDGSAIEADTVMFF